MRYYFISYSLLIQKSYTCCIKQNSLFFRIIFFGKLVRNIIVKDNKVMMFWNLYILEYLKHFPWINSNSPKHCTIAKFLSVNSTEVSVQCCVNSSWKHHFLLHEISSNATRCSSTEVTIYIDSVLLLEHFSGHVGNVLKSSKILIMLINFMQKN